MTGRTQPREGGPSLNHNEALQVRTSLKAGKIAVNHNDRVARYLEEIAADRACVKGDARMREDRR